MIINLVDLDLLSNSVSGIRHFQHVGVCGRLVPAVRRVPEAIDSAAQQHAVT